MGKLSRKNFRASRKNENKKPKERHTENLTKEKKAKNGTERS